MTDIKGMTVSERLLIMDELDRFETAIKNKDKHSDKSSGNGHVVVIQIGAQQVGFVVDSLIGQEEVVIKPLDAMLQGTPGMAGATITSDGGIALIFDVPNLLKHYAKRSNLRFK